MRVILYAHYPILCSYQPLSVCLSVWLSVSFYREVTLSVSEYFKSRFPLEKTVTSPVSQPSPNYHPLQDLTQISPIGQGDKARFDKV